MKYSRLIALLAVWPLLCSCSLFSDKKPEQQNNIPDPRQRRMGFEDQMNAPSGNPYTAASRDPNAVNYNVTTSEELEQIDNGAEGEVFFTDPDNPDAEIAGITEAFENRRGGNGWMQNYGNAIRFAHRECRPLLIWFHDSVISPKSKELGEHLLDSPKFNAWCKDRVVRVRLDAGASIDDAQRDNARYSRNAINRLSMRYGLRKKPALAVVSPSGNLMMGIDGYNGYVQEVETLIKDGVQRCEEEIDAMRVRLEKNGYRTWCSAGGNMTLFAKFQRYDTKNDMVYLREYGGRISKMRLMRFCQEDKNYIVDKVEKKKKKKPRA